MTTFLLVVTMLAVISIGFGSLVRSYLRTLDRRNFAVEFVNKYRELVEGYLQNRLDSDVYYWLTSRSVRMQDELGTHGIMSYRPPFSNYIVHNYPVVLNTLPDIRNGNVHSQDLLTVDDTLVRYIGVMDDVIANRRKELKNPLKWLREGVQWMLLLPFLILQWFGLLGASVINRVSSNIVFKFVAFIVTLIGLVSSVMGIALGWDQFIGIIRHYFV